jgi:hypothetical protein
VESSAQAPAASHQPQFESAGLSELGKMDSDPTGHKAGHTLAVLTATINPIYQSSLEYDSEGGGEVYMVGNGEELSEKMVKEIQWEADEEIARTARLDKEAERGTMAYRTTRVHRMMILGMAHSRGKTTRSSIHDTQQTKINPRGNRSNRVPGGRSTTLWHIMPWPQ